MAIRNIREFGDDILRKSSKPVKDMTPRLKSIIQDMFDTMYASEGVGLAGPQVGILKRVVVIDVGEQPLVLVNPEIVTTSGSQTGDEGCLSLPGKHAIVTRPENVTFRAQDIDMNWYEMEAEGLLARAVCHELDHLEGVLYTDKREGPIKDNSEPDEEGEE
ncbi:MAG: peptide deformylase [Lachnospiraceae bacterium]|nr:peptide deformylase [Lachnospiraceae bacterium]